MAKNSDSYSSKHLPITIGATYGAVQDPERDIYHIPVLPVIDSYKSETPKKSALKKTPTPVEARKRVSFKEEDGVEVRQLITALGKETTDQGTTGNSRQYTPPYARFDDALQEKAEMLSLTSNTRLEEHTRLILKDENDQWINSEDEWDKIKQTVAEYTVILDHETDELDDQNLLLKVITTSTFSKASPTWSHEADRAFEEYNAAQSLETQETSAPALSEIAPVATTEANPHCRLALHLQYSLSKPVSTNVKTILDGIEQDILAQELDNIGNKAQNERENKRQSIIQLLKTQHAAILGLSEDEQRELYELLPPVLRLHFVRNEQLAWIAANQEEKIQYETFPTRIASKATELEEFINNLEKNNLIDWEGRTEEQATLLCSAAFVLGRIGDKKFKIQLANQFQDNLEEPSRIIEYVNAVLDYANGQGIPSYADTQELLEIFKYKYEHERNQVKQLLQSELDHYQPIANELKQPVTRMNERVTVMSLHTDEITPVGIAAEAFFGKGLTKEQTPIIPSHE